MKLFLSSYRLGDHGDLFAQMAGGPGARVAIIPNAADAYPLEAQFAYTRTILNPLTWFDPWGLDAAIIDLRSFFGQTADLARVLRRYQAIWAPGGNSFLLRRAMRDSGFDTILGDLLADGMTYGGFSAGACVIGDDMRAVAIMDAPDETAPGHVTSDPIMTGLGLVPFTIIPHIDSDSAEAEAAAKAVAYAQAEGIAHVALRDGEVIVRRGDAIETLARKGD